MSSRKLQLAADLGLVLVTMVWGVTFVTIKEAIRFIPPFWFLAVRFGIATLIMLAVSGRRLCGMNVPSLLRGILTGLMLFAGYAFQTFGLKYTTASNAGFITGLSVVIVPVIYALTVRRLPGIMTSLGIASAVAGLGFLTVNENLKFNYGDILVLFCAVSYALHIILVGRFSPDSDPFILATVQIGAVASASFVAALIKETPPTAASFNPTVWEAVLVTAVLATALAFFLQTLIQKYTSPTHTAIIFTAEPLFAALAAYTAGGESFGWRQGIGAVLILSGMLAAELGNGKTKEEITKEIADDKLKV